MTNDEIDELVKQRDDARKRSDYAAADAIKAQLLAVNQDTSLVRQRVILLDEPGCTFWYWGIP